jgi:hypothetical protein
MRTMLAIGRLHRNVLYRELGCAPTCVATHDRAEHVTLRYISSLCRKAVKIPRFPMVLQLSSWFPAGSSVDYYVYSAYSSRRDV